MNNKDIFSYNLKFYMDLEGKSRKDVADAIGVSYFTFTDWVKGKAYPRMDKVELLAKYFRIKISDLVEMRHPEDLAIMHAEMLRDEDLIEVYEYFKTLDAKKRQIVKDLVRSLADA